MEPDKDLLRKLSYLKEIKPREEWVFSTRERLFSSLGKEKPLRKPRFSGIFEFAGFLRTSLEKPVLVIPVLSALVLGGLVWQVGTNSLPGDTLYPVRTAVERVPFAFSPEEQRPFMQLEITQRRLEDLRKIARDNRMQNLPSAIRELEANISAVSKSLASYVENQPEKALQAGRGIVELQKETSEIEKVLGTKIGGQDGEELDEATLFLRQIVEHELQDLEQRELTEAQQELLVIAQSSYEVEDYQAAFEAIWEITNTPNETSEEEER